MPVTVTIECRSEAEAVSLRQAAAFVAEMHQLAQEAPDGQVLHLAEAPVAMITVCPSTSRDSPVIRNGRFEKSTLSTFSMWTCVPKRSACFWNCAISSGPVTALGKPG